MSIFVIGINHKTAPVIVREKLYFTLDKISLYLRDLLNRGYVQEAVLISTCNRSELYCETDDVNGVREWFCCAGSKITRIEPALYIYCDEDAVSHIMQVACGLDSMVLGEPQILGQLKEAFSESCAAGAVGALFHRLFQQIFMMAKDIRDHDHDWCVSCVCRFRGHPFCQATSRFCSGQCRIDRCGRYDGITA